MRRIFSLKVAYKKEEEKKLGPKGMFKTVMPSQEQ
jgi:hypothetical protein